MNEKQNKMPVFMCKIPGQPAIVAGITSTSLARDGQTALTRYGFDLAYGEGQRREVVGMTAKGLLAKHVRGLAVEGAKKISLPSASNLSDLRFFAVYPDTGRVRPLTASGPKVANFQRNGLNTLEVMYAENNPALTGLGDHTLTLTRAEAKPRATASVKGEKPESEYGLDDSLILELLGIVDARASQPAADGQPTEQPEDKTASQTTDTEVLAGLPVA